MATQGCRQRPLRLPRAQAGQGRPSAQQSPLSPPHGPPTQSRPRPKPPVAPPGPPTPPTETTPSAGPSTVGNLPLWLLPAARRRSGTRSQRGGGAAHLGVEGDQAGAGPHGRGGTALRKVGPPAGVSPSKDRGGRKRLRRSARHFRGRSRTTGETPAVAGRLERDAPGERTGGRPPGGSWSSASSRRSVPGLRCCLRSHAPLYSRAKPAQPCLYSFSLCGKENTLWGNPLGPQSFPEVFLVVSGPGPASGRTIALCRQAAPLQSLRCRWGAPPAWGRGG